jgi:hypothetical protein
VSYDWLTKRLGPLGHVSAYVTPYPCRDYVTLHPIPNGDSRPSCFVSMSSHRHGLRTSCSASFHPWKSYHVTTGSCDSTCVTPWPLWQGLGIVIMSQLMLHPFCKGNSLLSSSAMLLHHQSWWTELCGTPTIAPYCPRQQPVQTC